MKKIHVISLILIVVSIGVIISASKDVSTYANFDTAVKSQQRVKIVGQLDKSKPVEYRPEIDAEKTKFYLKDNNGDVRQVLLLKAKPQDFELAEQIVLTGSMDSEVFVADEILMKCPSKYKDEEILLKSKK